MPPRPVVEIRPDVLPGLLEQVRKMESDLARLRAGIEAAMTERQPLEID
ncbi:MAG: hypothetical protein ACRC7O_05200 [Fimbriiglobus sp.]